MSNVWGSDTNTRNVDRSEHHAKKNGSTSRETSPTVDVTNTSKHNRA